MTFADFTATQAALWAAVTARRIAALGDGNETYKALYAMTEALALQCSYADLRAVYETQDAVSAVATLAMVGFIAPRISLDAMFNDGLTTGQ